MDHDAQMAGMIAMAKAMPKHGYDLGRIRGHETSRGYAWSAPLTLNGKKVAMVENAGNGGQTVADFEDPAARKAFAEMAKSTLPESGEPEHDFLENLSYCEE